MINKIQGKIQHYAWGGQQYLPHLLEIQNNNRQPFAEYWLGAHPKAPSVISSGNKDSITLNKLILEQPKLYLGEKTAEKFGRLPYLFKILDVHKMLSIQVHPSKKEAEKGFDRENNAGISLDDSQRNYKDDNHKPEMMVALSDFYLLHGFKEKNELLKQLETTAELRELAPIFQNKGYKALYSEVMNMAQEKVNALLAPLLERLTPLYKANKLEKTNPDFWAARAFVSGMTNMTQIDRGIFSIYFFNLLYLQKGEGIFQAAGLPHAYLEGQNIELMANSDNVLRGGLTKKHVDVKELLKHTVFEGIHPNIIKPDNSQTSIDYPCNVPDFDLQKIILKAGQTHQISSSSLEIALLISGEAIFYNKKEIYLKKGEAAMISAKEEITIKAQKETVIFKAGVPNN